MADVFIEPRIRGANEEETEWMDLNMGPQHPSTHGVLRVKLKLDGEVVRDADADIGYLHTGFEKSFEDKTYTQGITFSDRMDYLGPPINNVGFVSAVEKLMEIDVPPRAQAIRVMMMELARLGSHELWLGTAGLGLGVYSGFFTAWVCRELILRLTGAAPGRRQLTAFPRAGGDAGHHAAGSVWASDDAGVVSGRRNGPRAPYRPVNDTAPTHARAGAECLARLRLLVRPKPRDEVAECRGAAGRAGRDRGRCEAGGDGFRLAQCTQHC